MFLTVQRLLITANVILIFSGITFADQSKDVLWLMNEPLTLFDFGMQKLNIRLDKWSDTWRRDYVVPHYPDSYLSGSCSYNWNKHRIIIRVEVRLFPIKSNHLDFDESTARRIMKDLSKGLYLELGLGVDGEPIPGLTSGRSFLGLYFAHIGFQSPSRPLTVDDTIDRITTIEVDFNAEHSQMRSRLDLRQPISDITFTQKKHLNPSPVQEYKEDLGTSPYPQRLPTNGELESYVENRVAPLTIVTEENSPHYFVKVTSLSGQQILNVFIRSGQTVSVDVPLGSFEIKYAVGETWYGHKQLFGSDTQYGKADKVFHFTETSGSINGYTVELFLQPNGNLNTVKIDPSSF